eukprot:1104257-Prymnesium_polylepis.1
MAGGARAPKQKGEPPGRSGSERTLRRQQQRDRAAAKAAAMSGARGDAAEEPVASEANGDSQRAGRQQPQVKPAASEAGGDDPQPEPAATGARAASGAVVGAPGSASSM